MSVQRRFDRQFDAERVKARKHAALMKRKPELREQLYGARPPAPSAGTRETAQKENDNG